MIDNKVFSRPPSLPIDTRKKDVCVYPKLSMKELIQIIKEKCAPAEYFKQGMGEYYVVILPEAWEELKMIIGWGKKTPTNVFEQLYEGMGYCFSTGDNHWIVLVSHFLYIYAADRTPVSACIMKDGEYDSILSRIEYEREIYCKNEAKYNKSSEGYMYNPVVDECGPSYVNLYGHTHPDIGVFFSYDDRTSGFATPDFPAATFVADPIRKQMKAMVGVDQEEAQIIVFEYKKDVQMANFSPNESEMKEVRNSNKDTEIKDNKSVSDGRKAAEELVVELGRTCNELLNPIYGSKGNYVAKTTFTGKKHIKVDIKLSPKVESKRMASSSFSTRKESAIGGYNAYV